ncbi:serine/threonine-protein kinase 36 [Osmerus mordax]|uniref:serine/threonine-protein kinase 36 n=1 Tax=Osmerus mordax TaxID=8014 RepID=UPI00350FB351
MDLYHVLEMIGEGSFGRVYKGRKKFSGQVVALKFIPKVGRSEKELRSLKREIDIMKGLRHPNIVLLLDSVETEREVVVVTEYAEGELFQILEDDGNLPESQVAEIAHQLVSALYYLHSHRILHRDMKPQNILLGKGGVVKLCDFGFARAMSVSTLVLTSIKGTPLYMSPELVEEKPYDHTADLWSLGCILYELHTGVPPFYTNSIFQLVRLIVRDPVKWPENMSQPCMSFLKGLLTKDPQKRLSWPDLLKHPFVADGVVVLSDPSASSPLTVTPSPDMQALKLQQVAEKAPQHGGESRLLRKATEQRDKEKRSRQIGNGKAGPQRTAPSVKIPSQESPAAPLMCLDQDIAHAADNLSLTTMQPTNETSAVRGQISHDYEKEFPSVEVGPRQVRKHPEDGCSSLSSVRMHSQDVDSDEEWEQLVRETDPRRHTSNTSSQTIIPKLKRKLLTSKTQLLEGILEGACQIRQALKVLNNLILTSVPKDSFHIGREVELPHFLFDLVQDIVESPVVTKQPWCDSVLGEVMVVLLVYWEKHGEQAESRLEDSSKPFVKILLRPTPNSLAPLAASVLTMFIHSGGSVDISMDRLTPQISNLLDSDQSSITLPPGWGYCDGLLSLVLHTLSEHENDPLSASIDSSLLNQLWQRVNTSLEKTTPKTNVCSSNGLYAFLSIALLVLTKDPYSCVPLFSESDTKCIATLGHLLNTDYVQLLSEESPGQCWGDSSSSNLSVLSCHLLCFPFALDLPSETMAKLLQLYHSCGIVSGLLQVMRALPQSLLELPLSLLCRLLLCDPGRSVPCFTAAAGACNFFSCPRDREGKQNASSDQGPASENRTASSLLSALLRLEALWGSAVELLTLLSQAARCSSSSTCFQLQLEPTVLQQALVHSDDRVRAAACSLLGHLDPFVQTSTSDPKSALTPATFKDMIGCLHDPSPSVRRMSCRAVGNWLGLIGRAEVGTLKRVGACAMPDGIKSKDHSVCAQVGAGRNASSLVRKQMDKEEMNIWIEETKRASTMLPSLMTDPDALTRRHCCAALGNMATVDRGVSTLLEGDVPRLLLKTACADSHNAVRQAANATLILYSQQDTLRQALMSLDALEKLHQASQHAPPQCDYHQIIDQL